MIQWLLPAALAGLALALGPLLVHLLRRRQSRRAIVPTVRFVPAVSQSALRLRTPDDLLLLVLRTGAIAAAAVALAGPIVLTAERRRAWDARTVRAVVVDTSASVSSAASAGIIAAELQTGHASRRIDSDRIADGLRRAAAWLPTAPPGRREVVVISDFQHGSISASEVRTLPDGVGLRFVRTQTAPPDRIDGGHEMFDGRPGDRSISLEGWTTSVMVSGPSSASPSLRIEGASADEAAKLERIVRMAGVSWPRTAGMTVVRFGAAGGVADEGGATGSAAPPALRLLADQVVAGIPFSVSTDGDRLVVSTSVVPSSFDAAALVQAAIGSWRDPDAHVDAEVQSLPEATLEAWSRPPGPADPSAWRHAERSDGRWFWLVSLICLAGEWWVRGRPTAVEARHVRAA